MNNWSGTGRYTNDPKISYTDGGMCVARFTVAVNRQGKDKGADFISCVAFDKTAQVIEKYGAKGRLIGIQGHIQTGNYTNKDGQKVYTTDVIVDRMEFLDKASESKPDETDTASQQQIPQGFTQVDEDFPF